MTLRCLYCKRYLGDSHGTVIATLKCSNSKCKKLVNFKILSYDPEKDKYYKFTDKPKQAS